MVNLKSIQKFILIAVFGTTLSSLTTGQTLYSERNKLTALKAELSELTTTNADISQNLLEVEAELKNATANAPSDNDYETAKQNLADAEAAAAADPSAANTAKVDNAKFKLVLAERKYKRNNRDLFGLEKEQKQLAATLESNNKRQQAIEGQLTGLTSLVASLEAQEASRAKAAAEAKNVQKQQDLEAEIARLRADQEKREAEAKAAAEAELARQATEEAEQKAAEEAAAKAEPAAEAVTEAPVPTASVTTATDTASAAALIATHDKVRKESGKKGRATKIVDIKSYRNGNLVNKTSKSLKNKGNRQYTGRVQLRSGDVAFIAGRVKVKGTIESDKEKDVYNVYLDLRDEDNAIVSLVPTSLMP